MPKTCIHTQGRAHAPQSREDAITKDGIPCVPRGGRAEPAARLDDPNRARERLKNKQINKSSASCHVEGRWKDRSRKAPLVPAVLARPRCREAPDSPHLPEPLGRAGSRGAASARTPAAVCPERLAWPGSTPPPAAQLSPLAATEPSQQLKADSKVSPTRPTGKQLQEVTAEPGGGGGGD